MIVYVAYFLYMSKRGLRAPLFVLAAINLPSFFIIFLITIDIF